MSKSDGEISRERVSRAVTTVFRLADGRHGEMWDLLEAQLDFLDQWLQEGTVDAAKEWRLKKAYLRLRRWRRASELTKGGA